AAQAKAYLDASANQLSEIASHFVPEAPPANSVRSLHSLQPYSPAQTFPVRLPVIPLFKVRKKEETPLLFSKNNIIMKSKVFTVGEIKIRYKPKKVLNTPNLVTSQEVHKVLTQFFNAEIMALQEQFIVLYLNQANKLIGFYCMSTGGLTGTVADIRIILAVALKTNCTQMIISHNHPSGNLTASSADKELTRKLKEAASFMD